MRKAIMEAIIVTLVSFLLAGVIFASQYSLPEHGLTPAQVQAVITSLAH